MAEQIHQIKNEKGAANGYAPLDASSYVPSENLNISASDVGLGNVANVAQLPLTAATDNQVPAGFLNHSTTTLSLEENADATNDKFKVTITGTNFPVYCQGVKYTKNTETVTKTGATTKRYYIYYDSSGTLTLSDSSWSLEPGTFAGEAPVCTVYWDATNHRGVLEEERHHSWRDVNWHHWAHDSIGARYTSGYGMTKPVASGDIADFSIAQGEIYDEDIPLASSGDSTTCTMYYHTADGTMVFERDVTTLFKTTAGVPQYDNGTGLADKTQSNTTGYFVSWVYATNKYTNTKRIAVVIGQDSDGAMTLAEAQSASLPTLPAGFIVEWKLMYKVIFRYGVSATTWISTTDYRQSSSLPSGLIPTANISATVVSVAPAGNISSTNVQAALEELDSEKVAASLYDAHTVLYATTDNTPAALTVTEQTVVGRATGGNITALAIDSDLSSVSASDDTIPSAKATKAMGDAKVAKADYNAHTILYAATDDTPAALTVGEQTVVGRATGGNISALTIDSDLSSVSANDDTIPSAKATKAMGDAKLALAGGTMSGDITLGENTAVALDPAGSADGKYSGITITGTAGAALAFGDLITLDVDDSRWEKVDISVAAAATGDARGVLGVCVLAANADGDATKILLHGNVRADANFPALTIGAPVYASTTGDIVVAQPTTADYVIRIVGYALTADELYFNPGNSWTTHT